VKPSNILLTADGSPKVTDFGLAVLADRDGRVTSSGALLGTPSYMAPEQAAGKKDQIGPPTDVYAIGATLYELLTGEPPFKGESNVATAMKVVHDPVVAPRKRNPAVSPELDAVCLKCLEKAPGNRYASAAALADDLDAWREGRPTVARPLTRLQKVARFLRRNRAVAILAVAAASTAAFLYWGNSNLGTAGSTPRSPQELALAAQVEDLKAGKKVTLIPEAGLPLWYQWKLGEVEFDRTPSGGGVTAFQTKVLSLLELCPDPQQDRYRFQVDMRHDAGIESGACVGVYVGFNSAGPDYQTTYRWLGYEMNDKRLPDGVLVKAESLGLDANDYAYSPWSKDTVLQARQYELFPVRPVGTGVGVWRAVRIDVTPEEIRSYWIEPNEKPKLMQRITAERINDRTAKHRDKLAPSAVGPVDIPTWSPRFGLGVYGNVAAVSFRNATLEPLPKANPD
jgi:serine/threonine-protein kinase